MSGEFPTTEGSANEFLSFLPHHLARFFLAHPGSDPLNLEQRFCAATLFADISGFTGMSEALGRYGKTGTEELNRLLNLYFEDMITLIESYGGIIVKFAGDSMTVLFPYNEKNFQSKRGAARRAVQCALKMQEQMPRYTAISTVAGTFSLAMRAGLALGPVLSTNAGDIEGRLESIIAGSVLDRAAQAEQLAQIGEVVIHSELLSLAGESAAVPVDSVYFQLSGLAGATGKAPLPQFPPGPPELEKLAVAYLHPAVARRIKAGQTGFVAEHRKVTSLFVGFEDFDYDHDPDVVPKLQAYLRDVFEIINRYDGHLRQVDMGDKGSKFIVFFGAPVAHENDEERALSCALDLRQLAAQAGISTRTGIDTGLVFCGLVGSSSRREYSAIGAAINIAARLMQVCEPGQIMVSHATRRYVTTKFTFGELEPVAVKGRAEAVEVVELVGTAQEQEDGLHLPEFSLPMVGRVAELARVTGLLNLTQEGHGQVVGITAEAGMGKSRLVAEIIQLAHQKGLDIFNGECLSYASSSYHVWHSILRGLLGLDPEGKGLERLAAELSRLNPDYTERLPLLGLPLGLTLPDNESTRALDPAQRKVALEDLVVELLQKKAGGQLTAAKGPGNPHPTLLVLEDSHWLDPLSADLLEAVGRGIAGLPVMLVMAYRPPESEDNKSSRVMGLPHATEIRLEDFNREDAARLIELKLERLFGPRVEATPLLVEQVYERAQGNPFYIEEMVNLLRDRGLDPANAYKLQAVVWPDSLQSLILSRLDRLDEEEKTTLKVASVIGRSFKAEWLWGAYPQVGEPQEVLKQLEVLQRLEITSLDKPEPDLEYLFRHIVTRDVAYESLAYSTRAELHGLVGAYIERRYAGQLDVYLDILAYHYNHSTDLEKRREYLRRAGEAAQATFANETAISYYQQLLPLLNEGERVEILLKLGQVYELVGQWDEAEKTHARALKLAQRLRKEDKIADALQRMGSVKKLRGDFPQALVYFLRALEIRERLKDEKVIADTLNSIGTVQSIKGDVQQALEYFTRSLKIRERIKDQEGIARSLLNVGTANFNLGNFSEALDFYNRSQELSESIGDRVCLKQCHLGLGILQREKGTYLEALRSFHQGLKINESIGDKQGSAECLSQLGTLYFQWGDYAQAMSYTLRALEMLESLGDKCGVSNGLGSIGMIYIALGDLEKALEYSMRSLEIAENLGTRRELSNALNIIGTIYCRMGQEEHALPPLEKSAVLFKELGVERMVIANLSLRLICYQSLGQDEIAREALKECGERLENTNVDIHTRVAAFYNISFTLSRWKDNRPEGWEKYIQLAYETALEKINSARDEPTQKRLLETSPLIRGILTIYENTWSQI